MITLGKDLVLPKQDRYLTMALRIPWDIEEAVLMLDMLLKSIDGKLTRKEAIRQVSEKLRRRAVNRGITIDDIFRNENGITFQMSALEVAYTGRKTKLKQPTKLFVETVNLYRNNRELYEEILKEAENVVEPTSVQDKFCSYLSMQMPTFQLSDAYLMLSDIESFCLERKILQNKLFETTDLETIKRVVQTVDSNRVFRFTYKQNLKKMSTVIHAYYTFLKSYKPDEEKEAKLIIQEAIPSLPDADSMKQKDDAVIPQDISVPATERTKLTDLEERQKFNDWMLSSGMSKATIASYMSSFGQCVKSVANYKLCETSLWNVSNAEDASHIYDQLFGISEFYEYNKQQHNRFSAAFRKFIEYRSGGSPASLKPSQPARFAIEKMPTRRQENDPVLIRYKELLDKYFQKGFRMESSLDMKKLRRFYQEQYGAELSDEDDLVCQGISSVTILHDGKAYLPDSMLSQEKKEKLLQYIEDRFSSGCDAIYYGALFTEFEEAFQGERIYTPEMLKTYLSYINKGNYVLQRSYLAKDYTVQMNPEDDIREYLKEAAGPVEVKRLAAELSYIPEQKIKFALSTNSDFIWNTTGEYFYEDCVHFSNSELEWISQFILDGIEERDFVTGNELVEAVAAHFPDIKEMYQWITPVGMRNVIGYKLNDRFSFNSNIISKYGEDLSMAEVYAKYCRKHSRFTLDELNVLKQELGSTIYFDEIYANSLRISQNEFVSQDMAQFDVEATDEAIGRICTGQYMSLREIRDFGTFPYAGYPWNEYLLEHFVANYSQKFMLLHIGFSANVCAGAIVKQASSFKDFNNLLVDILANSNIVLDEDSALEYLRQQGYIARRRYSDIGRIVTEAKVVRSKKG